LRKPKKRSETKSGKRNPEKVTKVGLLAEQ